MKENYLKRTARRVGYSLSPTYLRIEVILDELQKNNVDMNMKTSYYINDLLQQHKTLYKQFTERVKFDEIISVVFAEEE